MIATMDIIKPMQLKDVPIAIGVGMSTLVSLKKRLCAISISREAPSDAFPRYTRGRGGERPIGDNFFRGVLSERYQEIGKGKMGRPRIYRHNEPLDATIYAIGAMYADGAHHHQDNWWGVYRSALLS